MPTQLKPGAMGPPDWPVTPPEFADSMAAAIEAEFNGLLQEDGLPLLPMDNSRETRDRRRLFVAIARGVLRHLDERRTAITVEREDGTDVSPAFDIDRPGGGWS
jgi:hypothetical protein